MRIHCSRSRGLSTDNDGAGSEVSLGSDLQAHNSCVHLGIRPPGSDHEVGIRDLEDQLSEPTNAYVATNSQTLGPGDRPAASCFT
ncbi:hypothetical protein CA13_65800 [Planctomycetes bacterium CA13]|uniref:Uncharacterized protein n=1 Tax=Novipirellula herctigrandis TaxID=2527986 RepID=A0A5C5ZD62_9BACT|nr:hypothetical protein CA13_65800 [Planctomycetes bacterium CA13]